MTLENAACWHLSGMGGPDKPGHDNLEEKQSQRLLAEEDGAGFLRFLGIFGEV